MLLIFWVLDDDEFFLVGKVVAQHTLVVVYAVDGRSRVVVLYRVLFFRSMY